MHKKLTGYKGEVDPDAGRVAVRRRRHPQAGHHRDGGNIRFHGERGAQGGGPAGRPRESRSRWWTCARPPRSTSRRSSVRCVAPAGCSSSPTLRATAVSAARSSRRCRTRRSRGWMPPVARVEAARAPIPHSPPLRRGTGAERGTSGRRRPRISAGMAGERMTASITVVIGGAGAIGSRSQHGAAGSRSHRLHLRHRAGRSGLRPPRHGRRGGRGCTRPCILRDRGRRRSAHRARQRHVHLAARRRYRVRAVGLERGHAYERDGVLARISTPGPHLDR